MSYQGYWSWLCSCWYEKWVLWSAAPGWPVCKWQLARQAAHSRLSCSLRTRSRRTSRCEWWRSCGRSSGRCVSTCSPGRWRRRCRYCCRGSRRPGTGRWASIECTRSVPCLPPVRKHTCARSDRKLSIWIWRNRWQLLDFIYKNI